MAEPKYYEKQKQTSRTNIHNIESHLGKVPPQAVDLEEAILGAVMLERNAIDDVVAFLKPIFFYKEAHQSIFEAVINLKNRFEPIDLLTVIKELRRIDKLEMAGGASYVSNLTTRVSSSANIEYHARIVTQEYIKRNIISQSYNFADLAFNPQKDVFELIQDIAIWQVELLESAQTEDNSINTEDLSESMLHVIDQAKKGNFDFLESGIKTPYQNLNDILPFIKLGDLVTIAARTSMGKSTFALDYAIKVSEVEGNKVGMISLEMTTGEKKDESKKESEQVKSVGELQAKIFANKTELDYSEFERNLADAKENNKKLEDYYSYEQILKIEAGAFFMRNSKIEFDYVEDVTAEKIKNTIIKFVKKKKCNVVFIDYIQLINTDSKSTVSDGIGKITKMLKNLAVRLNIAIVILAQVNREVEKGVGDHEPNLSHLKSSGHIEEDSNRVIFLYRPDYYGITEDAEGRPVKDMTVLIVAKNRGGKLGKVHLFHNLACSRYYDTYEQFELGKNKFKSTIKDFPQSISEPDPFYSAGRRDFF